MTEKAILCVDDEHIVLKSLTTQLATHFGDDFLYEIAESADDAFEVIEELQEDGLQLLIIVSDWLMPGIKGDEFLIKVHQQFPHIVKVMLTGQADEQAIERARQEANLLACLYKPWDEKELVHIIHRGLEQFGTASA